MCACVRVRVRACACRCTRVVVFVACVMLAHVCGLDVDVGVVVPEVVTAGVTLAYRAFGRVLALVGEVGELAGAWAPVSMHSALLASALTCIG